MGPKGGLPLLGAEEAVSAKSLGQDGAWHIRKSEREPVWLGYSERRGWHERRVSSDGPDRGALHAGPGREGRRRISKTGAGGGPLAGP